MVLNKFLKILFGLMGFFFLTCLPEEQKPENKLQGLISCNQIGYLPQMRKIAFIKFSQDEYSKIDPKLNLDFEIVEEKTFKVVFKGKAFIQNRFDRLSGFRLAQADFSTFNKPGRYFLRASQFGRSMYFTIGENIYVPLARALLKMLYFQRASYELKEEYAGKWARKGGHFRPGKLFEHPEIELEANGGWYDAGDYGRYVVPVAITIADLFLAWKINPSLFQDDLNIPESGNGLADILDEARWALDWLLKMQDKKNGGVYHKLTALDFPRMDLLPQADRSTLYFAPISATATADFAAILAQASRIWKNIDKAYAQKLLTAAILAWNWLEAHPKYPVFKNPPGLNSGEYGSNESDDERLWAAIELYLATKEQKYLNFFKRNINSFLDNSRIRSLFDWTEVTGFALLGLAEIIKEVKTDIPIDKIKSFLTQQLEIRTELASSGYLLPLSLDEINWGSNKNLTDNAKLFYLAQVYGIENEKKLLTENIVNYLLGNNPLEICFVTGFGTQSVLNPHHRPSAGDFVKEPVPGMVAGGPNKYLDDPTAKASLADKPPLLCYIDILDSYSTNEVTTYWNSSALVAVAYLLHFY